jgi:hypothetical protein
VNGDVGQRNGYVVPRQVAQVAERLSRRTDELATALARAITGGTPLHQSSPVDYFDSVVVSCAGTIRPIFAAIAAESTFDTREATELGAIRARQGMPLASLMESCRVGFVALGELVLAESAAQSDVGNDVVRALTAKLHAAQNVYTSAMVVGYREEQSRRLDNDETKRSVLFDSLLHGWLPEPQGLWGLADALRLPSSGPYMVIAAELPAVAATALPEIESKLRGVDVFSAWRLLPDLHVGVVHVSTDTHLANVLALISRMATTRVGASARYEDLRETALALRHARLMLGESVDAAKPVAVFDGSILACAAVSAPEVMIKLVEPTMRCFAALTEDERQVLFETFRAWLDSDGHVAAAAELLFCHPNTIRHRLRRIEKCTGRSLSRPRDVAELCLVFEVNRRLL